MNAATATIGGSAVCAKKLQPLSQIPRAITTRFGKTILWGISKLHHYPVGGGVRDRRMQPRSALSTTRRSRTRGSKRNQRHFGWAVETDRHPDRADSNVCIQGERTNPPQSPGIMSSQHRQDRSAIQRNADLAAVRVAGELQVHMLDVSSKVRFVSEQDHGFGLRNALQGQLEVGLSFQNVTHSR